MISLWLCYVFVIMLLCICYEVVVSCYDLLWYLTVWTWRRCCTRLMKWLATTSPVTRQQVSKNTTTPHIEIPWATESSWTAHVHCDCIGMVCLALLVTLWPSLYYFSRWAKLPMASSRLLGARMSSSTSVVWGTECLLQCGATVTRHAKMM